MTPNGTYLDRLMTERGLENYELAALVGVGRQSIWKLRTGLTRMLPHWAKRLAPHLGVSWLELIEGPPSAADKERAEWNAAFDALGGEQRRALLTVARMGGRADPPTAPAGDPSDAIPPKPNERAPPKRPFKGGNVARNPAKPDCDANVAKRRVVRLVEAEQR